MNQWLTMSDLPVDNYLLVSLLARTTYLGPEFEATPDAGGMGRILLVRRRSLTRRINIS